MGGTTSDQIRFPWKRKQQQQQPTKVDIFGGVFAPEVEGPARWRGRERPGLLLWARCFVLAMAAGASSRRRRPAAAAAVLGVEDRRVLAGGVKGFWREEEKALFGDDLIIGSDYIFFFK